MIDKHTCFPLRGTDTSTLPLSHHVMLASTHRGTWCTMLLFGSEYPSIVVYLCEERICKSCSSSFQSGCRLMLSGEQSSRCSSDSFQDEQVPWTSLKERLKAMAQSLPYRLFMHGSSNIWHGPMHSQWQRLLCQVVNVRSLLSPCAVRTQADFCRLVP